jgi:hypothetical protein
MLQNNLTHRSEEGIQSLTDSPRETLDGFRGGKAGRIYFMLKEFKILL